VPLQEAIAHQEVVLHLQDHRLLQEVVGQEDANNLKSFPHLNSSARMI